MAPPDGPDSDQSILDWITSIDVEDVTGLTQSTYDFSYRIFPDDLGNEDNNHYMVININVPTRRDGSRRSAFDTATSILDGEYSKVDYLRFGTGRPGLPNSTTGPSTGPFGIDIGNQPAKQAEPYAIPRDTRRIKESIALHMPNGGLVYTEDNKYEEISLTAVGGSIISAALGGIQNTFKGAGMPNLAGFTGIVRDSAGAVLQTGSQIIGYPINPRVEILFSTRPQRQWMFEVFMMPRTQKEAVTVKEIIRTLRFHAAPELDPATSGYTFIPPAEFDITFYRNGVENVSLPRINTCVLERVDMDFAPQGSYSTFRDGNPVAVRLSLGFREVEILHKARIYQGF